MLQECRVDSNQLLGAETRRALLCGKNTKFFLSHDAGIVLVNGDDWEIETMQRSSDPQKRCMLVAGVWRQQLRITLISVHAHVRSRSTKAQRERMWQSIHSEWGSLIRNGPSSGRELRHLAVMGGDWNQIWHLDDTNSARKECDGVGDHSSDEWSALRLFRQYDLEDPVRVHQPHGHLWTRRNVRKGQITVARRLDSLWISTPWIEHTEKALESCELTSDHLAVRLSIAVDKGDTSPDSKDAYGWWRLRPGLWLSQSTKDAVRSHALELSHSSRLMTAAERWISCYRGLRSFLCDASLKQGSANARLADDVEAIQHRIQNLDINTEDHRKELAALTPLVHDGLEQLHEQRRVRKGRKVPVEVFPSSWMARSDGPEGAHLGPLRRTADENETDDTSLQASIIYDYFTSLYAPDTSIAATDAESASSILLGSWHVNSQIADSVLGVSMTASELAEAVHTADRHAAPGCDGLDYTAFDCAEELMPVLSAFVNAVCAGTATISEDQAMARMVTLPKKGDLTLLSNWRPLAVMNAHMRIIGRAFAKRLQAICKDLIGTHQQAFLSGRSAGVVTGLLSAEIDAVMQGRAEPFILLSLDQEKAYDRVSRDWLFKVLEHVGCPQTYVNWLQSMFSATTLSFTVGSHRVEPIRPLSGVLQGAPDSPLLYILALEPFLSKLRSVGIDTFAYADDIVVLIRSREQLTSYNQIADWYAKASGGRINRTKSKAYIVAPSPTMDIPREETSGLQDSYNDAVDVVNLEEEDNGASDSTCSSSDMDNEERPSEFPSQTPTPSGFWSGLTDSDVPFALEWAKTFLHLGTVVSLQPPRQSEDDRSQFWANKLLHLLRAKNCLPKDLNLIRKVKLINGHVFSMLWYAMQTCPCSAATDSMFYERVRAWLFHGVEPIDRSVVFTPRKYGGLGLISPEQMQVALVGALLCKLLEQASFRKHLHEFLREKYGSHAHLFLRKGRRFREMAHPARRNGSFMDLVVYTLARLQVTLDTRPGACDDWSLNELLAVPLLQKGLGTLGDIPHLARYGDSGYWVYADALWCNTLDGDERYVDKDT